ncbi:hypothetical protein SPFM20_00135 [Salmonella phage SPFM20]|nr:hypothetical protein SPFM20_00135 [Salmonella phage SPFM20]
MAPGRLYPISSQFPPIGLGAIDSPYDAALSGQDYNNGEWRNTMQDCKVTKDGRTYRIRLPYAVMMYGTDDDGSVVPQGATATKFFPATMHSRSNSVQMAYQYGNMLTNDPQEWHKFIFHGRIVPNTEFFNTAELKLMLTAQQGGPGPQTILRGDWASGYFGTVVKDNERLIGSPITQGFYPDTFVDDIDTLTKNTTYRYWVAATIDVYNPGTPHATLSGSAVESQASKGLTAIEIYRKEGWNAYPIFELVE